MIKKIIFLSFLFLLFNITIVQADFSCVCKNNKKTIETSCNNCVQKCVDSSSVIQSCIEIGQAKDTNSPVKLDNPLGTDASPQKLIGRVINAVLGIVGSLALLMFVYGGITWMTSAGNDEKVKKGKDILIWATIGLVIIFASYSLVNFVITKAIQAPIT